MSRSDAVDAVVEVMQRELHSTHPDDAEVAAKILDRLGEIGWTPAPRGWLRRVTA